MYSISQFAQLVGLSKSSVRRYIHLNVIKPHVTPGGHYRFTQDMVDDFLAYRGEQVQSDTAKVIIYCRVSTNKQKKFLVNQVARCKEYATANGYKIESVITDVASSFNFGRKGLVKLLDQVVKGDVKTVVVFSKDRLSRIAFPLLKRLFALHNCPIDVIDDSDFVTSKEEHDDLVEELVSFIHYITSKLYGRRRYSKDTIKKKYLKELIKDDSINSSKSRSSRTKKKVSRKQNRKKR